MTLSIAVGPDLLLGAVRVLVRGGGAAAAAAAALAHRQRQDDAPHHLRLTLQGSNSMEKDCSRIGVEKSLQFCLQILDTKFNLRKC